MAEQEAWKWQEKGTAWKGVGIYHVTLVVPSRESLLGRLVIPESDPKQAVVERTEVGDRLVDELVNLHNYYNANPSILSYARPLACHNLRNTPDG